MKVKKIIEIAKWVDNSGWSYQTTYSNKVIDIPKIPGEDDFDWNFWEPEEMTDGEDLKITVKFYRPDYDPMFDNDEPLATYKTWQSEIN